MTEPLGEGAGAMAQAQVQALIKNAQSLGLIWGLRPATVSGYDGSVALAVMDGDTVPIAVTSMIGTLSAGQRVYVITVPPGGNYAVGEADLGWVSPTLLNSWANFGSGFQTARYRRLAGRVEIQGLVTGGTGPASTVFTLPVGYRPAAALIFATIASANVVARIDVEADGDVRWQAGGTNVFLSITCSFAI